MDLRLYLRVLRRFWPITILGLLLACGLAVLAQVRVEYREGKVEMTYRKDEQWVAYTTLFVSRDGFPWGSASVPNQQEIPAAVAPLTPPTLDNNLPRDEQGGTFADPSWFSELAVLYARLADSDPVLRIIERDGPIAGRVVADPVLALPNGGNVLPLVSGAGIERTPEEAQRLSSRAAAALQEYVAAQQEHNGIPVEERVQLSVVKDPAEAALFKARPMTAPVLAFLTTLIATIGLVFVLENLRPRRVSLASAPTPAPGAPPPPLSPGPGGGPSGELRGRALPLRVGVAGGPSAAVDQADEPAPVPAHVARPGRSWLRRR
jgi:hypothetical protein